MSIPSGPNHPLTLMGRTLQTKAEYHNTSEELVLDNGEAVKISGNSHELKIGCVTITWKAWELLQRRVQQIEGGAR